MIRFRASSFVLALSALSAVFALGCGGTGALGEACDTPGATDDECEEGSICDATSDDSPGEGDTICLAVCVDQEDCGADEACNGVTGSSTKACHPKDGDGLGGDDGKK